MTGTPNPTWSSNDIWWDEEMEQCLTLILEAMQSNITTLGTSKAAIDHTHDGYALANHTHTGYLTSSDLTGLATETYVNTQVSNLVNSAPEALNTLNELAAALGNDANFATTIATQIGNKADSTHTHNDLYYTESEVNTLLNAKANTNHTHNVFSSLTDIGITTFPTTMSAVAAAMPANSLVVIDTRRVNGGGTSYGTETISDWNNTTNGMAFIMRGVTNARVTMMILYGSSEADHGDFTVGNYAVTNNTVSWTTSADFLADKVDKIKKYAAIDLNTLTTSGLYYVSDETTALHCPAGSNGHLLVMSDGTRVRQVFFRVGTVNTNNFQWYSRSLGSDLTIGNNGWSDWWLLSGTEKVWNGGTVLNSEINIGSRYGCQSWVVVARLQNTGAMASVVIPRAFLTNDTDLYRFQIADETAFISFYIYYKSDNDVYLKVVDQTDSEYTTLKYVYRMS